jgi:phosphoglycerate dehydrogenase-like enzyme
VAVVPTPVQPIVEAVKTAGGTPVDSADACDAIVWTNPLDPGGLGKTLEDSPATWIQLPFAGIESFWSAGVIDDGHTWTCAKGIYGPSTAEHALALILAAARRLHFHARDRTWAAEGSADMEGSPWQRLKDKTVLIVGTGGIGSALTAMLEPLGPRVVGVNRSGRPLSGAELTDSVDSLPALLPEADFVVVAAALTDATRKLFDAEMLACMKPEAWLVNVARGGLVDTSALVEVLRAESIGGAALDVTDPEPLPGDHPLWRLDNALITPHVANTWAMAMPELAAMVERNVAAFARGGALEGLVDTSAGY